MATLIRATCNDCGDVELGTGDLVVRLCQDNNCGTYVFRCPRCDLPVVREAERAIVDLLVTSGVRMETWSLPAELGEGRSAGAPLSHDDLIDFHELLDQGDWFEELLAVSQWHEGQCP